jgi:predicted transcriptional regulator
MSWDQARAIANKLITLGLLKIDSQSRYTWTMLGKRILKKLAEKDAQIPEHEL